MAGTVGHPFQTLPCFLEGVHGEAGIDIALSCTLEHAVIQVAGQTVFRRRQILFDAKG